jgi:hypothetical protein
MEEALLREALSEGWCPENDAERRLVRKVPWIVDALESRVVDDVERALLGLGIADPSGRPLADRIRLAVAEADGGVRSPNFDLSAMETEAVALGDPALIIPAARLHAQVNTSREASARMSLSEQSLPYVFPGDVHPLMIDVLACGERVLPALHVDWLRKLTAWMAPALLADCSQSGLWFWPVLDVLDARKLKGAFEKAARRSLAPGVRGLMTAYAARVGVQLETGDHPMDRRIAAIAAIGQLRASSSSQRP